MNNLDMMRKRLQWQGGVHQEDRMIKDKWRTLQRVLLYSYQACTIQMVQHYTTVLTADPNPIDPDMQLPYMPVRALINPDKVKQDYDDKIVSLDYEHGYEPGDVFEWKKTGTHWIIYTQEITEDAYFRGEIRRCRYKIKFRDKDGNWCQTWAAIRGPVETQINSIQKNQERIDRPNLSLNILVPQNEKTLDAFERYKEFLFKDRCWRVEAPDSISMTNIIEVNAEEDYINRDTDDVENEMKNGLVIEPVDPSPDTDIIGDTFIKPKTATLYGIPETENRSGHWTLANDNVPVQLCNCKDRIVKVFWNKMVSGQFDLLWYPDDGGEPLSKTIVVESLY